MKQPILIIWLFLFFTITISAQKVTNVSNHQEQSTIIVSYDLETKTPCKIELYVSTNDGTNWQGPLIKVTGDVGLNVSSGGKAITWNVLEEFEELRGNNIVFQVRAADNEFETVKIGKQEWTIKNLNVSKYRNGDIIPEVKDPIEWASLTIGAWCYYNNDPKNGSIYGKLYNGFAVNDPRGLAPEGYHIPTEAEWEELIDFLGGGIIAAGKLKSTKNLWSSPNRNATNQSRFTALPGGHRTEDCDNLNSFFENIKLIGYWATFGYEKCYEDKNGGIYYSSGPGHYNYYNRSSCMRLQNEFTYYTNGSKDLGGLLMNGNYCHPKLLTKDGHSVRCIKN
jgi:uncharacterized protein (TIGR02145 family)